MRAVQSVEILQGLFSLPVINYFDDYLHIDMEVCASKSQAVMEEVLQLLGWTVSLEPKKRSPACRRFQVLGVVVDRTKMRQGVVIVSNKPERIEGLRKAREEIELIPPPLAARIEGRLKYAEAQCSGSPRANPQKSNRAQVREVAFGRDS